MSAWQTIVTSFPAGSSPPDTASSSTRSKAQTWSQFNHHALDNNKWVWRYIQETKTQCPTVTQDLIYYFWVIITSENKLISTKNHSTIVYYNLWQSGCDFTNGNWKQATAWISNLFSEFLYTLECCTKLRSSKHLQRNRFQECFDFFFRPPVQIAHSIQLVLANLILRQFLGHKLFRR